jgi:hypothetical protein
MIDGISDFLHGKYGPLYMNKTFFPIGSGTLFGKAAVSAIGRTPFRIMNQ